MIEAAGRVQAVLGDLTLDAFEADWQRHWLVQRVALRSFPRPAGIRRRR